MFSLMSNRDGADTLFSKLFCFLADSGSYFVKFRPFRLQEAVSRREEGLNKEMTKVFTLGVLGEFQSAQPLPT